MAWSSDDLGSRRLRVGAVGCEMADPGPCWSLDPVGGQVGRSSLPTELRKLRARNVFQGSLCSPGGCCRCQVRYRRTHSIALHHDEQGIPDRDSWEPAAFEHPSCTGHHAQLCTSTCPGDMSSIPQVLHRTAKPVAVAEFVDAVQAICRPRFPGARGRQRRPVGATTPPKV